MTVCKGARLLRAWLKAHDESQLAFAVRLGCTQGAVANWVGGRRRPSGQFAWFIEVHTGISQAFWTKKKGGR